MEVLHVMRSTSFIFSATTMLLLGAACGDDTSTTSGSGGDDAASTSAETSSTTGTPASTSNGNGGDPGTGGEGGTEPSTTSAGGEGGGGGEGGNGTGGEGGNGTGGEGGGTGAGGDAPSTYFGRVLFANGYYGVDEVLLDGSVSGTFSEIVDPGDPSGCVETVEGDCTLILCPTFEGELATVEPRLAGDLTVNGTLVEAPITYDDRFDYYGFYVGGQSLFAAGDELSVEATGDDVPAFTGSVIAPAHATITSPTAAELTFSLDEDIDITWDVDGSGGRLLAYLAVYEDDGSSAAIYCDWPIDDGAASMPATLVGELPPTSAAYLDFYDFSVSTVDAGEWVIEVAAQGTTQADTEGGTANFEGIVLE